MKGKGPPPEEKGEQAPLWIISFADMISLLMAFFVMLLTMSHSARTGKICEEGSGVFQKTMEGFRTSISSYGMPNWFGTERESADFGAEKSHYNVGGSGASSKLDTTRIIDYREEKIRQMYQKLSENAKTMKSQIQGSRPEFTVLPIAFSQGQAVLNSDSQQILNKFINDLSGASASIKTIYVVGLAPEESDETQQWVISTMRAQAVSDYIKTKVASRFAVYSWGAGSGGAWVTREGAISKDSQISIAVLKEHE
jgi:outer membrane protein OmpA-like peptidoglycan-associated protein